MRRFLIPGLALVIAATVAWNGRPPIRRITTTPVYAVPAVDTALVRTVTDTLFAHLGVAFDSVVLAPDSLLRLYLRSGMLVRPVQMTESSCASGPDPYPATQHVAERMYAPYARDRAIKGIVVQIHSDSAIDGGWFWKHWCVGGGSAAHYYRPQLDSLLATTDRAS